MDIGRVIAIQPIYANPTQPNPWVDPTHVHVWAGPHHAQGGGIWRGFPHSLLKAVSLAVLLLLLLLMITTKTIIIHPILAYC